MPENKERITEKENQKPETEGEKPQVTVGTTKDIPGRSGAELCLQDRRTEPQRGWEDDSRGDVLLKPDGPS